MIALIIKIILTLSSLGFTIFLFNDGSWGWGIMFIPVTILVGVFIFRNENILLALNQMRLQNVEKAAKYINRIKQPQYLIKGQRAYYYYMKALTGGKSNSMGQMEALFRKALSTGLRNAQDQAMTKMYIASLCMQTGRRREAETLLKESKKLDKKGVLTEHIKDLKKQMGKATSRNQMRQAQMQKGKKVFNKKMR